MDDYVTTHKCFNTLCKGMLRKYPLEKLLSDPIEIWECRYCYTQYTKHRSEEYDQFRIVYPIIRLNWADMYELIANK